MVNNTLHGLSLACRALKQINLWEWDHTHVIVEGQPEQMVRKFIGPSFTKLEVKVPAMVNKWSLNYASAGCNTWQVTTCTLLLSTLT